MDGGYALLDIGGGARLERFGDRVTDRPAPTANGERTDPAPWRTAHLRYDRDRGWSGDPGSMTPWTVDLDGITLELRPTDAGQVGLFPEHQAMLPWLRGRVAARSPGEAPAVLHLFAYTGLGTLAMAAAGAAVVHVDASRPTVAWARRNAELAGLAARPVRWIVDDALAFTEREVRRGHRYAGIVLDPPSYGHGPGTRPWRLEDDLPRLLAACARILGEDGFMLLTAHSLGFDDSVAGGDRSGLRWAGVPGRSRPASWR